MDSSLNFFPTQLQHCQLTSLHQQEKSAVIYTQGECANEFYFIKSGLVGLFHILENGKESLLRIYHTGEYFGFRTLFNNDHYHCTAKVLQATELVKIKPNTLPHFLVGNPEFTHLLLKQLAAELQDAEHRLAKISYTRSLDRVADSISYLTLHYPDYPWTYREIAEFSGCETETAIRISQKLKHQMS
ncbi:hypothetical protein A4G19_07565 [Pasteurellaceae bacterium Macca]|nr:hypothetical protein [Pasteurellaceae bacterium Macca]